MRSALTYLLILSLLAGPAATAWAIEPTPPPPHTGNISPLESRIIRTGPNTAVEQLRGQAALERVAQIATRNPGEGAAIATALQSRGFRPTDHAIAIRSLRMTARGWVPADEVQTLPAQAVSGQEGEVAFWTWDDGDNTTWEGLVHCVNYQKRRS